MDKRMDILGVMAAQPALRAVLLTDALALIAEFGGVVVLPWWITGRGGAGAMVAFGITLAVATFIVMPRKRSGERESGTRQAAGSHFSCRSPRAT